MVAIAQQDAPWSFGYISWGGLAFQQWVYNGKPSDPDPRHGAVLPRRPGAAWCACKLRWNRPIAWPLLLPRAWRCWRVPVRLWRSWRVRENATARRPAAAVGP